MTAVGTTMCAARAAQLRAFQVKSGSRSGLHQRHWLTSLVLFAAALVALGQAGPAVPRADGTVSMRPAEGTTTLDREAIADAFGGATVGFVANVGQSAPAVRFHGAAPGAGFYATDRGLTVALAKGTKRTEVLALRFLGGANPRPQIRASERLSGVVNVLSGEQARRGLARFGTLTYAQVWPGIDVRFRGANGVLKYEFLVAPGADPNRIRLAWQGAKRLGVRANGALAISTRSGTLTDRAPVSYQGGRKLASRYLLDENRRFGIAVADHDPARPLVVDPGLAYWTFLGGSSGDLGEGIAVDAAGAAYTTGQTFSPDFPSVDRPKPPLGYDQTHNGNSDAFVVKLDPTGATPVYWTFLGGSSNDGGEGIAVDAAGAAYTTGFTASSNFPSVDRPKPPLGYDQTHNGGSEAFVVKLDPTGATPVYWTFLGGSSNDVGRGIAVDAAGAAYTTGETQSSNFPSVDRPKPPLGYDQTYNGGSDAFVVKLDPTGATPVYWTFLGGSSFDAGRGIAVDAAGAAYTTGVTTSPDFPSVDRPKPPLGYDQTHNGNFDAFVVKLDPTGATPVYWTFLGGSSSDLGEGIAVDAAGAAYTTGQTSSPDFPSVDRPKPPLGYDQTHNGSFDAFVVKLDPTGATPVYWTFLGGSSFDLGRGIAVDAAGAAYTTGATGSPDFPSTDQLKLAPGYDQTHNGGTDAFVVKLLPVDVSQPCPKDDDEDDDGLEDRDENLLGTLLGDRDSDDDGRRDGNDDSDDDGEDDEDEDDDSKDECPNDSDGDGEDDEDEDDDEDD
jgi:hypothetical protein